MTVECVDCDRFAFRGCPLAREGFGSCELKSKAEAMSPTFPRNCDRFKQASAEKIAPRREWLQKRDDNRKA